MHLMPSPGRRLLLAVDMQRYSLKSNLDQYHSQRRFRGVMDRAAKLAGLDRERWIVQRDGDGEFSVLPPATSESTIVARFVADLDRLLRAYNRSAASHAKIRLRLALHTGPVHENADNGFAGEAVVAAARLVDAQELKEALDRFPDAGVALIVSDVIYQDMVRQRYEGIRPERFQQVKVQVKEYAGPAWIHIPDEDVTNPGGNRSTAQCGADADQLSYVVHSSTFNGPTIFGSGVAAESIDLRRDVSGGA